MPIEPVHVPIPGEAPSITLPELGDVFGGPGSALHHVATLPPLPREPEFTRKTLPGYVGTGISYSQYEGLTRGTRVPEIPALPVDMQRLVAGPSQKSGMSYGSWDLSYIDPLSSIDSLQSQFEGLTGGPGDTSPPGGGDMAAFLLERGMNSIPQPSRILDYGFSLPAVALRKLLGAGGPISPGAPTGVQPKYPFQGDPNYWNILPTLDDAQLQDLALREASRYTSQPAVLAQTLYDQFVKDREYATGLSSGDEHTDYLAKQYLSWVTDLAKSGAWAGDPDQKGWIASLLGGSLDMALKAVVSWIPGVGTPLARFIEPVSPETEAAWAALTPEQRQALWGSSTLLKSGTEMISFFPMFKGVGVVANLVRAGGVAAPGAPFAPLAVSGTRILADGTVEVLSGVTAGQRMLNVARQAAWSIGRATSVEGGIPVITGGKTGSWLYGSYQTTLNLLNLAMAEGVAATLTNWTLEAALPGYSEEMGRWVDQSAPFSSSVAGGMIDQMGYMASATLGVNTLFRISRAGVGSVAERLHMPSPAGAGENRSWSLFFGGQPMNDLKLKVYRDATGNRLNPDTFRLSAENTIYQRIRNWLVTGYLRRAERIADGLDPAYAGLSSEQRLAKANEYLRTVDDEVDMAATKLNDVIDMAYRPIRLREAAWMTDEDRLARSAIGKNARELSDTIAHSLISEYNVTWWQRELATMGQRADLAGYKAFLKAQAKRLGWQLDMTALEEALGKDASAGTLGKWQQYANGMVNHEYNVLNARLVAALEARPDLGLEAHPNDYVIVRDWHLFRDRADYFLAGFDQLGKEGELLAEEELQALKMTYLRTAPEVSGWYARALAPRGIALEDVSLEQLAEHIRDIYPTLPGRHHFWSATPETADLPINVLARELAEGKQYAIAYRTKEVVDYRPIYVEQANRVSRVAPDGWDARPFSAPGPGDMTVLDDLAAQGPLDPDYWYVPLWDTLPSDPLALEVNRQNVVPAFDAAQYQRMRTTDPYSLVLNAVPGEGPKIIARVAKDSPAGRAVEDISEQAEHGEYDGLVGWIRGKAKFDKNGALIIRTDLSKAPTASAPDAWLAADGTWHLPDDWQSAAHAYDPGLGESANLPNDGMFHATPVLSLIKENGLKARYDLRVADWNRPDLNGSGLTLRETLAGVAARGGGKLESLVLTDAEGLRWEIWPSNAFVTDAIEYQAFLGGTSGFGYSGIWKPLDGQPDTPIPNIERMGPQNIDEVWLRKPRAHDPYLAWKRGEKGPTGKGLFAHDSGDYVSVTYSRDHAEGIADRFRLGGDYVQGKTDITPVLDHFVPIYRKIAQGMWGDPNITDDLLTLPWANVDSVTAGLMIRTLKQKDANLFKGLGDPMDPSGPRIGVDEFVAILKATGPTDYVDRFKVFKALDNGLGSSVAMRLTNNRERWVGLLGGPEFLNEINVGDVGVVQVWRNKPFARLGSMDHIPNELELRFPSTNLWVVDPTVPAAHAGWRPLEPEPWRTNIHFAQDTELVALDSIHSTLGFLWPTKAFEPANIEALVDDLRANGMAEPVILEFSVPDNGIRIKSGNDRLAAAARLGWKEVPVVVIRRDKPFGPGTEYQGLTKPWMPGERDLNALGLKGPTLDAYLATGQVPATLPPSALEVGGWRSLVVNEERSPRLRQPWSGKIEDPAYGAEPVFRPVSVVTRQVETPEGKQTQTFHATFLEYPSRASVYLGNRNVLGRLIDGVTSAWRTWRMTDYQVSQAHRVIAAAVPGATAEQIENLVAKVYAMSYQEWSLFGKGAHGATPLPPQAVARLRADEINALGKKLLNADADYATMLTRAFTQAWTLNFTAALTSRIKTFGVLGHMSILTADWLVPYLRYQASLIFRPSELVESAVFNMLRGVRVTRGEAKAFSGMGISSRPGAIAEEVPVEPMAAGLLGGNASHVPPGPVGGLDELGGPFAIEKDVSDLIRGRYADDFKRLWDDAWNPNPVKDEMSFLEGMDLLRKDLPRLIEKADPGAYKLLHETMRVPDDQIARFLAEDRILYQRWQNGLADLATLTEHAAKFNPALSDKGDDLLQVIYATEDWRALEGLLRLGAVTAQTEGFSTHFFGRYRSLLERSVNHPVLGVYPASWAYKAAKEWGKFLYDNRSFGDGALRLGMTPAVAMQQLIHSINVAVAQNTDTNWGEWVQNGPMANWFFLFNLVMPGDWNSIPFPLARTLRTSLRELADGRLPMPTDLLGQFLLGPNNRGGIGIFRDISLASRGVFDIYNAWANNGNGDQYQNLVEGLSAAGNPTVPPDWNKLLQYPVDPFSLASGGGR